MSACRECRRPIKFVHITTTQRPMPIDAVPDEGGNVFARVVGGRLAGHVKTKGEDLPEGWQIFMPHHATCEVANRGRSSAPVPSRAPTLFDLPTETTEGAGPRGTEGTA